LKAHVITWIASVLATCILGAAWIHTHPATRLARVDVGSLFEEQKKSLAARIKPGMSEVEQKALYQSAADYARRVDGALAVVARECGCALMNSAAILRLPDGKDTGIPDLTDRARQLLAGGK